MKKLLFLVLIVSLPLIAYFQYVRFRKFNPPTSYEYKASESIDMNYHDQLLIEEYYSKIVELSAYARLKWKNEGVDVKFPDQASETELNIAAYYNQLLSRIKWIEARLVSSREFRALGFGNDQIKLIEAGKSIHQVQFDPLRSQLTVLKIGDGGEAVWVLQKQLVSRSDGHILDGVFGIETQQVLKDFQESVGLYPSGQMSEMTYDSLFKY